MVRFNQLWGILMTRFIWDPQKELENIRKHGVDFTMAANAFFDEKRKIFSDERHSHVEPRFFCIGKAGDWILTVRFVYRGDFIRIIGAGYWRKGRRYYETQQE